MSNTRLPMRKICEVLRLYHTCRQSRRRIAATCGLSRSTVSDYLGRATAAGLAWPLPEGLTEADLESRLFPAAVPSQAGANNKPLPDFAYIHSELVVHKRYNLTLELLWCEYMEQHPDGYKYSYFCELYRSWLGRRDYCMRQDHKAGEKLFVDYGDGLEVWDAAGGKARRTHLFVAVWGASNYTYAEASLTQELPAWCGSHVRALEYFGVAPLVVVPDNLKSAVTGASYYEPEINRTYAALAEHYGFAVIPARPAHPRDKPKVENGVLVAKRWILARLRKRTFYSLGEMNTAIRELLEYLNHREMRKLKQNRREVFEAVDRPKAQGLPANAYEYAEWRKARVNVDYHVEVDGHYYSVPFRLLKEEVEIRLTARAVEIYRRGERVAAHLRSQEKHRHTTETGHMPPEHQKYLEWSPSRIISWAEKVGPATAELTRRIMEIRAHPEQGYRSCLGILRLSKSYGDKRLEAASARAVRFSALSFRSVKSILEKRLDQQPVERPAAQRVLPYHENLRGGQYYSS